MKNITKQNGFTMLETVIAAAILTVVGAAGIMLLSSGQNLWLFNDSRLRIQDDLRKSLSRLSLELQESGQDSTSTLQVIINDNTGVNNTDVLRFKIPICPCGVNAIAEDGEIRYWGAPLNWGDAGCTTNYTLTNNNKVDICHLPPGNPSNTQSISVNESAVKAHLAHGDWLGDCNSCTPANYTNQTVEYSLNNNNELLRRVLDGGNNLINEVVFARNVTNFQTSLNAGQTVVSVTIEVTRQASSGRTLTLSRTINTLLRNL